MSPVSPENTYALVVGIECYFKAKWPGLNGPVLDACKFVDWLRSRNVNVDPKHISLFLSPLKGNANIKPNDLEVIDRPATSQLIHDEIMNHIASLPNVDLLLVFWGGHGLGDGEDRRLLLYADASPRDPRCLDVQSFLQMLRSDSFANVRQQIVVIDACATYKEFVGLPATVPRNEFPRGNPRSGVSQFVLYASRLGERAANLNRERSGALSREVRAEFERAAFPPEMSSIAPRIAERFRELDQAGLLHQVPTVFSYTDGSGEHYEKFRRGNVAGAEALEWLVPKLYDRGRQEAVFSDALNKGVQDDTPVLTSIVYGREFEQHVSFVRRIIEKRVRPKVTQLSDPGRGACHVVSDILTDDRGSVDDLKLVLRYKLATALALDETSTNGWELLKRAGLDQYAAVAIPHLIRLRQNSGAHVGTLQWYLDEFWRPLTGPSESSTPRVLIFVMIELAEENDRRRLLRPRSWISGPGSMILNALKSLTPDGGPRHLLDELPALEQSDVTDWFLEYAKGRAGFVEDHECREEARKVYDEADRRRRERDVRRTDSIESLLARRYRNLIESERVHS